MQQYNTVVSCERFRCAHCARPPFAPCSLQSCNLQPCSAPPAACNLRACCLQPCNLETSTSWQEASKFTKLRDADDIPKTICLYDGLLTRENDTSLYFRRDEGGAAIQLRTVLSNIRIKYEGWATYTPSILPHSTSKILENISGSLGALPPSLLCP